MRGWWGAVGLLVCGCWRVNPAFIVGLEEHTSGDVESTGDPGMSSGSGSTGGADTTGDPGGSSGPGTTAVEPGTTTSDPSTTTTSAGTTTTTGDPGSSSGGETTGGPFACDDALLNPKQFPPLYQFVMAPCTAQWEGGDYSGQASLVAAKCPGPSAAGFAQTNPNGLLVAPNVQFGTSLITGTRTLVNKKGTIEGTFFGLDLTAAALPCLVARVGCPVGGPSPCGVDLQVSVRVTGDDWGTPQIPGMNPPLFVGEDGAVDIALSLADFAGQKIDVLLVAINDGVGLPQEVVAWDNPRIVDLAVP